MIIINNELTETSRRYKHFNYPLIRYTELNDEDLASIIDTCINTIKEHSKDYEKICKIVKEWLDKKYSPSWNLIIGSNYGSEITFESKKILHFYYGIDYAILIWKCNYRF